MKFNEEQLESILEAWVLGEVLNWSLPGQFWHEEMLTYDRRFMVGRVTVKARHLLVQVKAVLKGTPLEDYAGEDVVTRMTLNKALSLFTDRTKET